MEFSTSRTITRQGDSDNDIYLIVAGSVSIIINKRQIAVTEIDDPVVAVNV